ncbi:MAG: glutamyl-tRNA reductase [Rhabdochlamydiaceae bacterium]|jgi:glutamyl-tRNA reductase
MRIGVLGINYKSSEIGTRESVSKACQIKISQGSAIAEDYRCVVLSTCNRLEIYFSCENLAEAHSALLNMLREEIDTAFEHKLYSFFGLDCFMHLAGVTSGLDSAIIAESEIQRQVKVAYEQTLLHYSLPSCMHFLFQKSLKLGKQIRSTFSLSQNGVTIAKILFQLSEHLLGGLSDLPVLFIGNSEINRKGMAHFKRKGVKKITLCTRSLLSAKEMSEKEGLTLLPWEKLPSWQEYPLIICGSNAARYIVDNPGENLTARLIFDLSVPRNVDPILARHPKLILLNMEELTVLIERKQEKNLLEINRAETLILEGVQRYYHTFRQKEKRTFACV